MSDREKQILADIREQFSKHEITLLDTDDPVQRLVWKNPETINFSITYLLYNGTLCVMGDLGEATYCWSGDIKTFDWIADTNFGYFLGKCVSSENGRGYKTWEGDEAERFIKEYLDTYVETEYCDNGGVPDDIKSKAIARLQEDGAFGASSSQQEWVEWIRENEELVVELYGQDYWEFLYDAGTVPDFRAYTHWLGLVCAIEKQEALNEKQ